MADYRFLIADLLTDQIEAELPVESAGFTHTLNGPGALTAAIRLGAEPERHAPSGTAGVTETFTPPAPDVRAGAHAIYVERDGVIVWGGVVWTYDADVVSNTGTIGAEGFFSLLRGRVLETDYLPAVLKDQGLIVKELIDEIQGYTEGDHLIDTSTIDTSTGVTRNVGWEAWERKDVGQAIEELANTRDGFDFRIRCRWGSTTPVREFLIDYPATGRPTAIVLELGRNLELLRHTDDATTLASKIFVRGSGSSSSVATATTHNTGTGYVRRDLVASADDTSDTSVLTDIALRYADRGASPTRIPYVAIYPDQDPKIGSFTIGDIVELRGTYGAIDFGGNYRITGWSVSIDVSGQEKIDLTLAPEDLFA